MVHIGPYDDESATFEKLADFLQKEDYERASKEHKEIYMSDPHRANQKNEDDFACLDCSKGNPLIRRK